MQFKNDTKQIANTKTILWHADVKNQNGRTTKKSWRIKLQIYKKSVIKESVKDYIRHNNVCRYEKRTSKSVLSNGKTAVISALSRK
jgi:hypothetical protein